MKLFKSRKVPKKLPERNEGRFENGLKIIRKQKTFLVSGTADVRLQRADADESDCPRSIHARGEEIFCKWFPLRTSFSKTFEEFLKVPFIFKL